MLWLIIWLIAYELISKFIDVNLRWSEESNYAFFNALAKIKKAYLSGRLI